MPMHRRSHPTHLAVVCLVLGAGCNSKSGAMSPSGVTMQPPLAGVPATSAGTFGAAGIAGLGSSGSAGFGAAGTPGAAGANPGGAAGTGSSTTAGTGAISGAAGSGSAAGDVGEYFASGAWHGYVWTSAEGMGSTITPMDFKAQTTGMPRCVKGSVAATTDYSGIAMLGFNLNQPSGGSALMTVTPSKAGVLIAVTNTAGSPLRFQVTAGDGATQQRWCASVTGSGGFIPWTSLNTACWDGSGTAYNKEPISAAMLLVPGTTAAAVPFDFCVNSLAEADAPAGGAAGTGAAGNGAAGMGAAGNGAAGMGAAGNGAAGTAAAGSGGTAYPPIQGGCDGYATRYWDCCKPHCGWSANAPAGVSPLAVCDRSDNSLGGNFDAANSCEGGPGFLCQSLAPWSTDARTAYGFAAVAARGDICGKCYQLEFSGRSHNAGDDPGAAALAGKTMIVQSINIGGDVGSNQFDIAIPGGGVGAFNACSTQWGVPASELGVQYGGLLASCKQQSNASDHQALKNCVMQKCTSVFEARGLTELAAGCRWYVEWFQVADNPALKYAEIACPSELTGKGLRRTSAASNACLR
jgi:hypothetical protein